MKTIRGRDYRGGMKVSELVGSFETMGLQASELWKAVQVAKAMDKECDTVFLAFTSNMASSGLRETIAQLCRERKVDAVITGAGSIEEDIMKSWGGFGLGTFDEDDAKLNAKGTNRIGNILVHNRSYLKLEKFLKGYFTKKYAASKGKPLAPHEIFRELGGMLNDKGSFLYWCSRNGIPVFCPAPTDGAFGLQTFFFKQDHPGFAIDVTGDQPKLANMVLTAKKTGAIILGGGFAKHHTIGVNLLRGGLDYAVYVSTATEFDGSLSGARTKEAVSWGKIRKGAATAYVHCDASIALPLLVAGMDC